MTQQHQGGCHCGQVRYAISAALEDVAHCHCSVCRRSSGGLLVTWLTVPLAAFNWTSGKPAEYASSATCTRYFCPNCGAQLALMTQLSPQSMDVTVTTLDQPELARANRHIWVGSRLPWVQLDPQLPEELEEQL